MPKKGTKHVKDSGIAKRHNKGDSTKSDIKSKHFRSVHIGVSNGRRWLSLRKRLGLLTDEELAAYLLDLADSIVRYV